MKDPKFIFATALVLMLTCAAHAQVAEPAQGYGAFRVLRTRNIFDPERRAERAEITSPSAQATTPTSRSNFIALTGTMVTDSKSLAFFTGSQLDHSKVIGVGDKVADFTVKGITGAQVELEQAGKITALGIGRQITLAGLMMESAASPSSPPPPDAPPASGAAASPPAPAGGQSDVLRRMMERRQKENSK